ncbi:MAG: peptidoglycan bridge formation glycyltransferase FemA/FemB family protein, partial [archaeon]
AKVDNYTMLIDLTKSEEELWKELDKGSIRWGVGYAERNGLKASVAKAEEIDEFYKLYEETANTGRFTPESKDFVKRVAISDIGKLFVIKKDAKIVAGGLILVDEHNNYSILDLTSASESGLKLQAMPFLYWSLISYSKKRGLNYFDLGGFDREAKEGEKTHSINKFKERFGGKVVLQPIYATNWKYKLFRRILKRVRFMKGAYTKK